MAAAQLLIPPAVLAELTAHAAAGRPLEACGFLSGSAAGGVARATAFHPVGNELASPAAFRTAPRDTLSAFKAMRSAGTDVVAIYHSHPSSAAVPSRHDVAGNTYGESALWLIVGFPPGADEPEVRAWRPTADGFAEVGWAVDRG